MGGLIRVLISWAGAGAAAWLLISPRVLLAVAVMSVALALVQYARVMHDLVLGGKGVADQPQGKEPAFKQYFFHKASLDCMATVYWSETGFREFNRRRRERAQEVLKEVDPFVFLPWVLLYFLLLGLSRLLCRGVIRLAGLLHSILVGLCATVIWISAVLLTSLEVVRMARNYIRPACPGCYRRIPIPIYHCSCGREHARLVPGSYGLLRRRCACGCWLATTFLFGRSSISSYCPECRWPLNEMIGNKPDLRLLLVGGPNAGKTSLLMANLHELDRRQQEGKLKMAIPEKQDRALFERSRQDFASGLLVAKTVMTAPSAFQVNLCDASDQEHLLSIYDPAGEAFQNQDTLRGHEYYGYANGILFLLDPFSLPEVQLDWTGALVQSAAQIKPCLENPKHTFDRMLATFNLHMAKVQRAEIPCAVVLTKTDAFELHRQIATTQVENLSDLDHAAQGQESLQVRQWLLNNGADHLVRSLESEFKRVRYFACSALGRLPDERAAPFVPHAALKPLEWLLAHYRLRLDAPPRPPWRRKLAVRRAQVTAWVLKMLSRIPPTIGQNIIFMLWAAATLTLLMCTLALLWRWYG